MSEDRPTFKARVFNAEDDLFQIHCLNQALLRMTESINLEPGVANVFASIASAQEDYIKTARIVLYDGV